ncbi:MAG TPA: VWA domain-containing protein [Bryobacteraceae bacterium]|nr:VWA domain-containing protein [Bryobacteraceae bacterium]
MLPQTVAPARDANGPEISSQDTAATFNAKVNLVMVPVVVRDRAGHAIGNLQQQDFQLFDKGKPQVITKFSVEKPGSRSIQVNNASGENAASAEEPNTKSVALPDRYVAYVFDDLHIDFGDLMQVRKAAQHQLSTLAASDRAAIFTTSGQGNQDFTDDRDKLQQALAKLMPRPMQTPRGGLDCPDLSYYQADQIVNKNDQQALTAAVLEVTTCMPNTPASAAQALATSTAMQIVNIGEHDALLSLGVLEDIVRRISAMPGQRTMILISPGFITPDPMALERITDVLNRATHANLIISALDARGLSTTDGDASRGSINLTATRMKQEFDREAARANEDVMAELADGTGGTFFHNNNDLNEGLRRVATAPEYYYLLGFSPQNLKSDGSFHRLRVTVKNAAVAQVQARRGYFVPKHAESEADAAKQQIQDAIFSRDEMHDLPVDLHTQFFKTSAEDAKLTVLAHVDVQRIHFEKVDGRNRNNLTVVAVLFDRNGNYISGQQKLLQMRLRDETLGKLSSGITVRTNFDAKPGSYFIRLIVRDTNGQMMAAENGAVEIP